MGNYYCEVTSKGKKSSNLHWAVGGIILAVVCFILLYFSELQMPTISSGIVAIISAIIGVALTVIVTSVLLNQQSKTQKDLLEHRSNE
jgi:multidrug transporter EmrE-like cation transporter